MGVGKRIGPSTLIAEAGGAHAITSLVSAIQATGFKAIEICPAQFQSDDPFTNPSFIDALFNEAQRRTFGRPSARFKSSPSTAPHTG